MTESQKEKTGKIASMIIAIILAVTLFYCGMIWRDLTEANKIAGAFQSNDEACCEKATKYYKSKEFRQHVYKGFLLMQESMKEYEQANIWRAEQ